MSPVLARIAVLSVSSLPGAALRSVQESDLVVTTRPVEQEPEDEWRAPPSLLRTTCLAQPGSVGGTAVPPATLLWVGLDLAPVPTLARHGFRVVELLGPEDAAGSVPVELTRKALSAAVNDVIEQCGETHADAERILLVADRTRVPLEWLLGFQDAEGDRPSLRAVVLVGPRPEGTEPPSCPRLPIHEVSEVAPLLGETSVLRTELRPRPVGLLALDFSSEEGDREHFEFLDPSSWTVTGYGRGRCLSQFVKASEYQPPHRSPTHFALLRETVPASFTLDVDLRSTHLPYPHRDVCIAFCWQDPAHFYYAHLGQNADASSHTILVVDGADRTPIVERRTTGIAWDDHWHRVRLVRDAADGAIRVYFDDFDHPVLEAHDTRFGAGRIALGTFDDTADFDSLRIFGDASE